MKKKIIIIILLIANSISLFAQSAADTSYLYVADSDNIDIEISIWQEQDTTFKDTIVKHQVLQAKIWNRNHESIYIPDRKSYNTVADWEIKKSNRCFTTFGATNKFTYWRRLLAGDTIVYKFRFIEEETETCLSISKRFSFTLPYMRKDIYDKLLKKSLRKQSFTDEDEEGNIYIFGGSGSTPISNLSMGFGYIIITNKNPKR